MVGPGGALQPYKYNNLEESGTPSRSAVFQGFLLRVSHPFVPWKNTHKGTGRAARHGRAYDAWRAVFRFGAWCHHTFGAVLNWALGRLLVHYVDRPWCPANAKRLEQASHLFRRYGKWSLLFSWVPIVG